MKNILAFVLMVMVAFSLVACSSSSTYTTKNDNYDYDKGYGYTAPKQGEGLSDYIKRQDPDLYKSMEDRWNSLK